MAEIKIEKLKIDAETSAEMIELRSDAEEGNSKAFTAFVTLRGGMREIAAEKQTCWACWS